MDAQFTARECPAALGAVPDFAWCGSVVYRLFSPSVESRTEVPAAFTAHREGLAARPPQASAFSIDLKSSKRTRWT